MMKNMGKNHQIIQHLQIQFIKLNLKRIKNDSKQEKMREKCLLTSCLFYYHVKLTFFNVGAQRLRCKGQK